MSNRKPKSFAKLCLESAERAGLLQPGTDFEMTITPPQTQSKGETMNQERTLVGEELTQWEQEALKRAIENGPVPATSGTSAIFDASWELVRRGMMREHYRLGPVYLVATKLGLDAYARSQGRAMPTVREHCKILCDEAGVPRDYETNGLSLFELAIKLAVARGEVEVPGGKRKKRKTVAS